MNRESTKNDIEIDLRGLFSAISKKIVIIILVGVLTGGIAFVYARYFVEPQYVSTTKVYILSKQNPEQKTLTTSDLAFATYLANDYQILLTSEPVLQEVKEELHLSMSTSKLASMISVELKEDTRIMDISVTSTSPKMAKAIADKVRDVANAKTKAVMDGIEAVNPIDEAKLPTSPASPNIKKYTLLGAIAGVGISLIIVSLIFIFDDTIKTTDDIENYLGISVLAAIPKKSGKADSKKKKRKNTREYGDSKQLEKKSEKKVPKDKKVS
ncbi:MAG: YveK family protein [Eubacterium sp.]